MRFIVTTFCIAVAISAAGQEPGSVRQYQNKLTLLKDPPPLLADYPEFVEPDKELTRYEAPLLVDDEAHILFPHHAARIDQAHQQELAILPVRGRQVRPDLLPFAE